MLLPGFSTNCNNSFLTSLVFPPLLLIIVVSCKTKYIEISSEVIFLFSIIYSVVLFFLEHTTFYKM